MTKREICESKTSIAYYSGFNGLEVKSIIHGLHVEIYAVANAWGGKKKTYHKLRVFSNTKGNFIRLHGYKCYLNDFIRM